MSPLAQKSRSNHCTPRGNASLAINPRQLNYDLTRDKPCVSARASLDYGRKAPERKLDIQIPADKPCVSLPGESTTAWRRDPNIYLEYSNQYAITQRPGRGQRLKTASDRDELPYCRAKKEKKDDGAYAKPLVGYRNYQGPVSRQPTAVRQEMTRRPTGASEGAMRNKELRSSYKEFRVTIFSSIPVFFHHAHIHGLHSFDEWGKSK